MIGGNKRVDDTADEFAYKICRNCWASRPDRECYCTIYWRHWSDNIQDFFDIPGRLEKFWAILQRDRFSLLLCGVKQIRVIAQCRTFDVRLDTMTRSKIKYDDGDPMNDQSYVDSLWRYDREIKSRHG